MQEPDSILIEAIFHEALSLPPSQQTEFILKNCAGKTECERKVKSLLKAAATSSVLDRSIIAIGQQSIIGQTLNNRYVVDRKLEHEGMGELYLALDQTFGGKTVVIKTLAKVVSEDPYVRQKFEHEVDALLRIEHPNVVSVTDRGHLPDDRPCFVMQFVKGETLRTQIPNEGMPLERAAAVIKQIGEALDAVHREGIVHRDLKPENIMLQGPTDRVVIIDFGIAKIDDTLTDPGVNPGTVSYMSPEQLRGREVTLASDIYAIGVIAYELVTGRRPFNPISALDMVELQRKGKQVRPINLRRDLSLKADEMILRALSFDPKKRPKSAGAFGTGLASALSGVNENRIERPLVSRKALAILVGLVLCLAGVGFGIYKYRMSQSEVVATRQMTYTLTVQRMSDGKEYGVPYKVQDIETFNRGDKFRITVSKTEPGYLYILNEGPPEPNDTNFWMIYPNVTTNNGSATIGANQSVESNWITFRGPEGTENVWIVWSVSQIPQLEDAKTSAFQHPKGGLTNEHLVRAKEFLRDKLAEAKVKVTRYKESQTAVVRGKRDFLVTLAEIKHR